MSVAPKKTAHRKPKQSYGMYVSKLLKSVDSEAGFQGDAKAVAVSMTSDLINQLATETKDLLVKDGDKQVQARHVMTAASTLIPAYKKADSVAAVTKFTANKKGSKSERAGLILPVARIHTMLKSHKVGSSVSPAAAVVVAQVVEDELTHVLSEANKLRKDDKVKRVTAQHIKRAISRDMTHLQGDMKRGGVHENIHESLVPKKRKRSEEAPATKRAKK